MISLILYTSTCCVLRGGSWGGLEIYVPTGRRTASIPTGEVYQSTRFRDSEGRQIFALNPDLSKQVPAALR